MGQHRTVDRVLPARLILDGEGFEVRRVIPAARLEAVEPFIFLDNLGPLEFAPGEAKGASVLHGPGDRTQ